ncbi:hypothetical protein PNA2_0647 [Pyrococcus sp. NA2]|uniref:DUF835 domain-containing protein n=1 Tax=Pyrococcus sp. (strain NA2) TaxID=342949 RepID=UPI000209ACA5|nr:DUF835 domain-containing protein [Pyrococcus sp. NA2]AEC51563.1 hypothetical protein PNA2_0647 [Pyrococcus sp. NA2]
MVVNPMLVLGLGIMFVSIFLLVYTLGLSRLDVTRRLTISAIFMLASSVFMILHSVRASSLALIVAILLMLSAYFTVSWDIFRSLSTSRNISGETKGGVFLVRDLKKLEGTLVLFSRAGYKVLMVTRAPPGKLNVEKHVWISRVEGGVSPTDLHRILNIVLEFLAKNKKTIVIIDCMDYLLMYNSFRSVARFLFTLKDYVLLSSGILILYANEGLLGEKEFNVLKREFPTTDPEDIVRRFLPVGMFGMIEGIEGGGG